MVVSLVATQCVLEITGMVFDSPGFRFGSDAAVSWPHLAVTQVPFGGAGGATPSRATICLVAESAVRRSLTPDVLVRIRARQTNSPKIHEKII